MIYLRWLASSVFAKSQRPILLPSDGFDNRGIGPRERLQLKVLPVTIDVCRKLIVPDVVGCAFGIRKVFELSSATSDSWTYRHGLCRDIVGQVPIAGRGPRLMRRRSRGSRRRWRVRQLELFNDVFVVVPHSADPRLLVVQRDVQSRVPEMPRGRDPGRTAADDGDALDWPSEVIGRHVSGASGVHSEPV